MQLQINATGAWKHVCNFAIEATDLAKVAGDAIGMLEVQHGWPKATLRIVDGVGQTVLRWDQERRWFVPQIPGPGYVWVA